MKKIVRSGIVSLVMGIGVTGCLTPMEKASYKGDVPALRRLLDQGADVNARSAWHYSPLSCAAVQGRCEAVAFLLDHGADINRPEEFRGTTALIEASFNNRADCVKLLIDRGADIDYRSPAGSLWVGAGKTAMECAQYYGQAAETVNVFAEVMRARELKKKQEAAQSLAEQLRGTPLERLVDFPVGGDLTILAAVTDRLIEAKNIELPGFIATASVERRVALLTSVEKRMMATQTDVVALNAQAEDALLKNQDTADFRRHIGKLQAYMAVLAEIKTMLMQS